MTSTAESIDARPQAAMNTLKASVVLACLLATVLAREFEIEDFKPDTKIKSDPYVDFGTLRITKVKRNQFVASGEYEFKQNVGDEKTLLLEVHSRTTGTLIVRQEYPVCSFLQKEKKIIPDLVAHSNIPPEIMTGLCPFPAGKYWIKNFNFDEKKFESMPPGNYKGRLTLLERGKALAAVEINASIKL